MKIGILTYHSVYNFGANLQVFSTVEYLKNEGYTPIVINWIPKDLEDRYNRTIPEAQITSHKEYIANNIPCTELCRTEQDIADIIKRYDIKGVIIGSDAVLRHSTFISRIKISKKGFTIKKKPASDILFPNPFWGSFIPLLEEKIPVIIMSASSQNAKFRFFRGILRKKMDIALYQFKLITVRDNWTKRMVKYLTYGSIVPEITPDPVFAFNQNVKKQLSKEEIVKKFSLPEKYVLVSFRSKFCFTYEWLAALGKISEEKGFEIVVLPMPEGIKFKHPFKHFIEMPLSPEEWYGLIKFSSGYIGENMHPVVVALHNVVPFYAFDSYGIVRLKYFVIKESSKIFDILSRAGLHGNSVNILGHGYKCPAPEAVVQSLLDFDLKKCQEFSNKQLDLYNSMMRNILKQMRG